MSGWAIAAQAAANVGSKLLDREWGINSANRINDHQYNNSLDYQRNVYSAQVQGLRAAGLNPILAATNGGSFTGSAGAVPMGGSDAISTASQYELQKEQRQLFHDQQHKTVAEENNITADTRRKEEETKLLNAQTTYWNNQARYSFADANMKEIESRWHTDTTKTLEKTLGTASSASQIAKILFQMFNSRK